MLTFSIDADDNYVVTQTLMSFLTTTVVDIRYSKDLTRKQVASDPWQDTTQADRDWFYGYYLSKFAI